VGQGGHPHNHPLSRHSQFPAQSAEHSYAHVWPKLGQAAPDWAIAAVALSGHVSRTGLPTSAPAMAASEGTTGPGLAVPDVQATPTRDAANAKT